MTTKLERNSFKYNIPDDWMPSREDFMWGNVLLLSENHNPRSLPRYFSALYYCVLTLREKFDMNQRMFYDLLNNDLIEPHDIIHRQDTLYDVLGKYGFGKRKAGIILHAAHQWDSLDIVDFMFKDEQREHGEELRERIIDNVKDLGYKLTSLFLRMGGYRNLIPVDSTFQAFIEGKGYVFQKPLSSGKKQGLKPVPYKQYEGVGREIAGDLGVHPDHLQATVYAKWSTWKVDSGATNLDPLLRYNLQEY